MMTRLLLACVLALASASLAFAEEGLLSWDKGAFDVFDFSELESHYIQFVKPQGWDHIFPVELSFYGQRYGAVGDVKATIVLWGPQTAKTGFIKDKKDSLVIYGRKQFAMSAVPEQPGWFTVPLETQELPDSFGVSIFTHSTEERGVRIALDAKSDETSHSATITSELLAEGEDKIAFREDGRNWMIRLKVRSTLEPVAAVDAAQLTGDKFTAYDDGASDGFTTFTKYGPLLHVRNSGRRTVKRVYVYAKAEGDWFKTERTATVFLLDSGLQIQYRTKLPYKSFTNLPSWQAVEFSAPMPADFYVLVEPASRMAVKLLLGYDTSAKNIASAFGTHGAFKNWSSDAPEASTNWMIRVEYE